MNPDLTHPDCDPSDEEFLDEILDRAIEFLRDGTEPDPAALAGSHGHLLDRIGAVIVLARQILPRTPGIMPKVAGYTLIAEIGRGGMGTVYLARQERLGGRSVALKVLAGVALSSTAKSRFRRESEAIARLNHPNIVGVHDVIEGAEPPAFAMEWVEGRSFAALIEHVRTEIASGTRGSGSALIGRTREFVEGVVAPGSGRRPSDWESIWGPTWTITVCRIGIAIARALAAVHEAGMLHRDVKPSNILIRSDGRALLTDFGLAQEKDPASPAPSRAFAGTPAFAPPELLREHDAVPSARSDLYSLGVTLYQALALRLPFRGQSATAILRSVESGSITRLRSIDRRIPRDLETIIEKAMEVDPLRRYASALDLADDLERLLKLQPIQARPAGFAARALKAMRRNRRFLAAGLAGAALVGGLASAAYVLASVLPRRSEEALREARLSLLHPRFAESAMAVPRDGAGATGPRSLDPERIALGQQLSDEALKHYETARRLTPWRADVRVEQTVVLASREAVHSADAKVRESFAAALAVDAPVAARYLRSAFDPGVEPISSGELVGVDDVDLRAAGLLAFLIGDGHQAQAFWGRLSHSAQADPFVSALVAQIAFVERRWDRVYVRLHLAREGFPDAAYLTVALADAALHLGDAEEARGLLELAAVEAERRPMHKDPSESDRRVWAGYWAATGEDARAIEHYEFFRQGRKHPAARENYATFLASRGRFQDATMVAFELLAISDRPRFRQLFLDCAFQWKEVAEDQSVERPRDVERGPRTWADEAEATGWGPCLATLIECSETRLSAPSPWPSRHRPARRSPQDGTLPPPEPWLVDQMGSCCAAHAGP